MSDLEQVFLPLPTSLPPQNEANTNNYNNNAYHGSIIEVSNDNAFEYFYSIVRKKNLNEFLLVFPFAYILVLEVNNITLLLVQRNLFIPVLREMLVNLLQSTGGSVLAIGSTGDSADLWSCLDRGSLDDHFKNFLHSLDAL